MPTQLPSGRWRTRLRHPRTRKQLAAWQVVGGPDTFATRAEAAAAETEARRLLATRDRVRDTVREFWVDRTTAPLWRRPSASTNLHYAERTRAFVLEHGDLAIRTVGDDHVAAWLKGGRNRGTVDTLRTMWNDAASAP